MWILNICKKNWILYICTCISKSQAGKGAPVVALIIPLPAPLLSPSWYMTLWVCKKEMRERERERERDSVLLCYKGYPPGIFTCRSIFILSCSNFSRALLFFLLCHGVRLIYQCFKIPLQLCLSKVTVIKFFRRYRWISVSRTGYSRLPRLCRSRSPVPFVFST